MTTPMVIACFTSLGAGLLASPATIGFPCSWWGPAVLGGPLAFQLSSGFACLLCWKNRVVCCFFLTTGVEQHRGLINLFFLYLVDEPT